MNTLQYPCYPSERDFAVVVVVAVAAVVVDAKPFVCDVLGTGEAAGNT